MKPMLLFLLSLLPLLSPAMPTAEEIAAAEPLVQEVMKAELDALRSGKKTREQVGDAALAEDQRGLTTKYTKREEWGMVSRVERVERVEGQSGIICGI